MSVSESTIPAEIRARFEFHNYGHALEILHMSCVEEWGDILSALRSLTITGLDITSSGGNESVIPKKFSDVLRPRLWDEIRFSADLHVKVYQRNSGLTEERIIRRYVDGHNIDYIKGKIAFDLEWNSKDQTFDRDILAMRTFFECGLIDAGVIVTRAESLNEVFRELNVISKYGASTTWMGKLLPRLDSRRQGGCPILAVGIRKECVEGWSLSHSAQQ